MSGRNDLSVTSLSIITALGNLNVNRPGQSGRKHWIQHDRWLEKSRC